MPDVPPVTKATLFLSIMIFLLLCNFIFAGSYTELRSMSAFEGKFGLTSLRALSMPQRAAYRDQQAELNQYTRLIPVDVLMG